MAWHDCCCGIGRLTQQQVNEPIKGYLGLDIIPEVLDEAGAMSVGDARSGTVTGTGTS